MSGDFRLEELYRAGAYAGAALAVEHVLMYDPEQFTREPEAVLLGSNVAGVLTIAVAYGLAKRSTTAALEVLTIATVAASVVVVLRYARRSQRVGSAVDFLAGRIAERIEEARGDGESYARNGTRNL